MLVIKVAQIFSVKCIKSVWGPDPLGELTALPQTSGFKSVRALRARAGTREGGKGKRQEGIDS